MRTPKYVVRFGGAYPGYAGGAWTVRRFHSAPARPASKRYALKFTSQATAELHLACLRNIFASHPEWDQCLIDEAVIEPVEETTAGANS